MKRLKFYEAVDTIFTGLFDDLLFEFLGNEIWKYLYRIYFCKIWNSNDRSNVK